MSPEELARMLLAQARENGVRESAQALLDEHPDSEAAPYARDLIDALDDLEAQYPDA